MFSQGLGRLECDPSGLPAGRGVVERGRRADAVRASGEQAARPQLVDDHSGESGAAAQSNQASPSQGALEIKGRGVGCRRGASGAADVAALDSQTTGAGSADAVAHLLAHVKKLAKQQAGNSFILRSDERVVDLLAARKTETELVSEPMTGSLVAASFPVLL